MSSQLPQRPRLVTFSISHFCEKARWALDWHAISYEEICWPIGWHRVLAKASGAPGATVPLLLDRGTVVQGSGGIIDWAEGAGAGRGNGLASEEARAIERRADSRVGVHVRRLVYAEMLPAMPAAVRRELLRNNSTPHYLIGAAMWPVTRRLMMQGLGLGPGAASASRDVLEGELDWIDGLLADGRFYLAGDRFTRADIAVASLLAPLARPAEMPVFSAMTLPAPLLADIDRWGSRPSIRYVTRMYAQHRAWRRLA